MPTFDNFKQLKKYFEESIKESINEDVKKEIITTIREHIEKDVNSVYDPTVYDRENYLEKSLVGETNKTQGGINLEVSHDESEMYYNSVVTGSSIDGNAVASWIEKGEIYPLWGYTSKDGESFTYLEPRPYMKNSIKELKDEKVISHVLKKSLKEKGIESNVL